MEDSNLEKLFSDVGTEHMYDSVRAEYVAYRNLKVRWQRSYRWADFKVSDYMADAPDPVISGLARTLFSRIGGETEAYSAEMTEWLTDPSFCREKQPIFLRRSRNLTGSSEGEYKNLKDSIDRLESEGLDVKKVNSLIVSWAKSNRMKKAEESSVLMHVVGISDVLDDFTVPDCVVDYLVYSGICRIAAGFDPGEASVETKYGELLNKFKRKDEAKRWIDKSGLYT